MTIKSTVSFTDRHHQYATQKVKDGACASVSGLVAAGIEQLILDEEEREIALHAMSDAIKSRMNTPRSEWIEGTDDMFEQARQFLNTKTTA